MSFFKRVQEGAAKAAEKAKETVEVSRLSTQISSKKRDIARIQQNIGEMVYQSYLTEGSESSEASVIPMCDQISVLYREIAGIELKIKEIKNEKDCVCGKVVPLDTRFCSSCGHKFEERHQEENEAPLAESEAEVEEIVVECAECHAPLEPGATFCGNCGTSFLK